MAEEREVFTDQEAVTIRVGSKECDMPKTFFVKDLKNVAGIEKDRSIVLHRDGQAVILGDDEKVNIKEGDYFKDVPPLEQGSHEKE